MSVTGSLRRADKAARMVSQTMTDRACQCGAGRTGRWRFRRRAASPAGKGSEEREARPCWKGVLFPRLRDAWTAAFLATGSSAFAQEAPPSSVLSPLPLTSPVTDSAPAGDLLTPQNLLQLEYRVRTNDGTNADGEPRTVTTDIVKLRGDLGIMLDANSQLVLRGDLPYIGKNPVTDSNPGGDFVYGIGDADLQGAVVHQFGARWIFGAGFRVIMPTGGDALGSDKWQAMPLAGFRYVLPELGKGSYFEPLVRYDVSFAGNPEARNINNLQFGPMLNLSLPHRWFFALYPSPEIRWNFGDPITGQTGRLFLPLDFRVGKKFNDNFNASLEVSVPIIKQYPLYNFMTALRLNLTF